MKLRVASRWVMTGMGFAFLALFWSQAALRRSSSIQVPRGEEAHLQVDSQSVARADGRRPGLRD